MNQRYSFFDALLVTSLAHESCANYQAKPALPMHGHQVSVSCYLKFIMSSFGFRLFSSDLFQKNYPSHENPAQRT